MDDYPRDSLKRFDVVLLEVTLNRYRVGHREDGSKGDLWRSPWDKCNWMTNLKLESICLLLDADPKYGDPSFPMAGGLSLPASPSKARGFEI